MVLIAVSLFICGTSSQTRDGRQLIKDMLPDWKDVTDARDAFRYYLGYSDQRPMFGRFTYAEKMEYWALVWGMFVMASTGLMAWFKVGVGERVPGWWIDVAITIHFYEAVLATLAIIVWHLYGVMFDPDAYPMNWAWYRRQDVDRALRARASAGSDGDREGRQLRRRATAPAAEESCRDDGQPQIADPDEIQAISSGHFVPDSATLVILVAISNSLW